jgi:hypothetical protein
MPAIGFHHTIVIGEIVYDYARYTGALPGRVVSPV